LRRKVGAGAKAGGNGRDKKERRKKKGTVGRKKKAQVGKKVNHDIGQLLGIGYWDKGGENKKWVL